MRESLSGFVRRNDLENLAPMRIASKAYAYWAIREWRKRGEPSPPPSAIKRITMADYGVRYGLRTLVETGTYYGDTMFNLRTKFDRLISIELDPFLYRRAKRRLAGFSNVTLLFGNSGDLIDSVIKEISQPALFWLDAHYMGGSNVRGELDSPISAELSAILEHSIKEHVILIDDARYFKGEGGYPKIPHLRESVIARRPDMLFDVKQDIIRICPTRTGLSTAAN